MTSRIVSLPTLQGLSADVVRVSETLDIALAELRATKRHARQLSEQSARDRQVIEQLKERLDWMERRLGRNSPVD